MQSIEKTAATVDEAIREGLKQLGAEKDEVEIKILEAGSKGFFGIGSKPAKVFIECKFDPGKIAARFISQVAQAMGLQVEIETKMRERQLYVNVKGKDIGILIGKRGSTLDSLQYLLNLVVNKGNGPYIAITLDTENYRQRRKETLEALAHNLAKKAKMTKSRVVLEPMSSYERRIIHSALQNDRYVNTFSEGEEPYRYVVITNK